MSFRRFTNRTRKDQDLAEEIDSHLAHAQDANAARGLSPEEARRQAYVRFGNPRSMRERMWRYRSFPLIEDFLRDLRFALRGLSKTPGFTVIAILVIGVGIGANTAVFSVINTVLLKPLTYPDPQSLVELRNTSAHGSFPAPTCRSSTSGISRQVFFSRSRPMTSAEPGLTSPVATIRNRYRASMCLPATLPCSAPRSLPDAPEELTAHIKTQSGRRTERSAGPLTEPSHCRISTGCPTWN